MVGRCEILLKALLGVVCFHCNNVELAAAVSVKLLKGA